jgi:hypothetical protein
MSQIRDGVTNRTNLKGATVGAQDDAEDCSSRPALPRLWAVFVAVVAAVGDDPVGSRAR